MQLLTMEAGRTDSEEHHPAQALLLTCSTEHCRARHLQYLASWSLQESHSNPWRDCHTANVVSATELSECSPDSLVYPEEIMVNGHNLETRSLWFIKLCLAVVGRKLSDSWHNLEQPFMILSKWRKISREWALIMKCQCRSLTCASPCTCWCSGWRLCAWSRRLAVWRRSKGSLQ